MKGGWPAPYLQPDRTKDCMYFAVAYLCRCLGYDTSADDVMRFRESTHIHEGHYAEYVLGLETRTYTRRSAQEPEYQIYWMGQDGRPWVESYLRGGWLGLVVVRRIPMMDHAVVLLEASDSGAYIMDPLSGFVTEPWEWFLGQGPGNHGCHRIEAWVHPDAGGSDPLGTAIPERREA